MGNIRFGAPREFISWIRETYAVNTFIETGTNQAETAAWAAAVFPRVFTVEGFPPLHERAVARHGHLTNVSFLLGDSKVVLPRILQDLDEPAIIWLDAHWCGEQTFGDDHECPVLAEIAAINDSALSHFILVDDARLFLAPPPRPHRAEDWPDIATLCRQLSADDSPRYVFVHEDVVTAVPRAAAAPFIDHLRSLPIAGSATAVHDRPAAARRSLCARITSRIRRLIG